MAKNKLREQMSQSFLDALDQGRIPWHACWSMGRPYNGATGRKYQGANAAYLSYIANEMGYSDPRWATYNQAQNKGWQVLRGEKGTPVEYWAFYDLQQKKLLDWKEARLLQGTEYAEKNLTLRVYLSTVFNVQQMDGVPPIEQQQTDIGELRSHRDLLLQNMGVNYREEGNQAYYQPSLDTIVLPPEASFEDVYAYMCTFMHEAGHATGHPTRLNRELSTVKSGEAYASEELRAEIASAFTAQAIGLQLSPQQLQYHMDQHKAYIQSWASVLRDAPSELYAAIRDAEKISDYLLENGEFEAAPAPAELLMQTENSPKSAIHMQTGAEPVSAAWEKNDHRPSPFELYKQELQSWQRAGMPNGVQFILGSTGPVLQGLGAIESDIYIHGDKIKSIMQDHPQMTLREIAQIPQILEDPVLVLKSRNAWQSSKNTRLVMFGSIKAQDGNPVLAVLDLRPVENKLVLDNMQKLVSAYTKNLNPIQYLTNSEVLYADKKRTTSLLRTMGFNTPIELQRSGYMGSISYWGQKVKLEGKEFCDVVRTPENNSAAHSPNAISEKGVLHLDPVADSSTVVFHYAPSSSSGGLLLHIDGPQLLPDFAHEQQQPWHDRAHEVTEVSVSEGVSYIGSRCFYRLPELQRISLPSSLQELGYLALDDCSKLQEVEYHGSSEQWNAVVKGWNYFPSQFTKDAWQQHMTSDQDHTTENDSWGDQPGVASTMEIG